VELIPASVEVAEIAVEEEEEKDLEGADEEEEEEDVGDAARVRLFAGDEAMVISINRAMVSAMLLLVLLLVQRRRVVLVGV